MYIGWRAPFATLVLRWMMLWKWPNKQKFDRRQMPGNIKELVCWPARKRVLTAVGFRCITEVRFRLTADCRISKLPAPDRSLKATGFGQQCGRDSDKPGTRHRPGADIQRSSLPGPSGWTRGEGLVQRRMSRRNAERALAQPLQQTPLGELAVQRIRLARKVWYARMRPVRSTRRPTLSGAAWLATKVCRRIAAAGSRRA
jgi:hypothetical protein